MPERYTLSQEMAKLVQDTVEDYLHRIHHAAGARNRRTVKRDKPAIYQAQCTEEIPAATDELTDPGLGKARLLIRNEDDLQAYDPDRSVDVVNHSDAASFAVDQYLKVELIDNQWQPYYPSGGGGDFIEGLVTDNSCPSGTLDITVKYTSSSGYCDEVIRVTVDFEIMDGHAAAQLTDAKALAGRVGDCTAEEWVLHLWLLAGLDECTGLP